MKGHRLKKYLILILTIAYLAPVIDLNAYMPPFSFVARKAVENRGMGGYQIIQHVEFSHREQPFIVKEQWEILSDANMVLTASPLPPAGAPALSGAEAGLYAFRWHSHYSGSVRTLVNSLGALRGQNLTTDWFEDLFWMRTPERFSSRLMGLGLIPRDFAVTRSQRTASDYQPEPFLRLNRVSGMVSIAIGPKPTAVGEALPGVWLVQDRFDLLKLRLPTGVEVLVDQKGVLGENGSKERLFYPQVRTVKFQSGEAKLRVQSITPLNRNLSAADLDPRLAQVGSGDPVVDAFYQRFR